MISILIPAFNVDVRQLVHSLSDQCERLHITYEIRVIDDGSDFSFLQNFQEIGKLPLTHVSTQKNAGRSITRNRLIKEAQYDHLLFIDADCLPSSDNFIFSYYKRFTQNTQKEIFVGGVCYPEKPLDKRLHLHWYYGKKREEVSVDQRKITPYRYFFTANICGHKRCFPQGIFSEQIDGYGYEDIATGYQLKRDGFTITHIENPVIHQGLKNTTQVLEDIKEASGQLAKLYKAGKLTTKLTDRYESLSRWRLSHIVSGALSLYEPALHQWIKRFPAHLPVFDALKLIYFQKNL